MNTSLIRRPSQLMALAFVIALALTALTGTPAQAHTHRSGHADVSFTVQSGLSNYDITDLLMQNAGPVTDAGICKLYPVSGNPGDPVGDPNWLDVHLVDNQVTSTWYVTRTDMTVTFAFRTCDDPPDVRNVATVTSLATQMPKIKPAKTHSCVINVSNVGNTLPAEVEFGTFHNGQGDGLVVVQPGETKQVNVARATIDFFGYLDTGSIYELPKQAYAGYVRLRGLKVTKSCRQHATGYPAGYPN